MKFLAQIPLLVFPLIVYIVVSVVSPDWISIDTTADAEVIAVAETDATFESNSVDKVFVMKLVSGATWGLTFGEILLTVSILLLFVEVFKSTRSSTASIIDHMLSTFVFVAYVVLFLIWGLAGSSTFFLLTLISMVDVLSGFTVSISSARRDVSFND